MVRRVEWLFGCEQQSGVRSTDGVRIVLWFTGVSVERVVRLSLLQAGLQSTAVVLGDRSRHARCNRYDAGRDVPEESDVHNQLRGADGVCELYNGQTNTQYVNTLMGRYSLRSITTPDPANPDGATKVTLTTADLINRLNGVGGTLTRAQVLRAIADSDQVGTAEANQGFVAMQYYGYLRRTPDTAGFNSWINHLNANPTDFRTMVNGFMNSAEYRLRFGPQN